MAGHEVFPTPLRLCLKVRMCIVPLLFLQAMGLNTCQFQQGQLMMPLLFLHDETDSKYVLLLEARSVFRNPRPPVRLHENASPALNIKPRF